MARTRRRFLAALARAGGAAVFSGVAGGCDLTCAPPPGSGPAPKTLSRRAFAVIEAAAARLVPSDDLPGAREARVVVYIDAELAAPRLVTFRREVEHGTEVLDRLAEARGERGFAESPPARQDEILSAVQRGEDAEEGFAPAHFFQVLLTLTLEGLLGDPIHGGNHDEAGWKLIGWSPHEPRHSHG
jgi:gluconate 2-dehydrogenase gamma chain